MSANPGGTSARKRQRARDDGGGEGEGGTPGKLTRRDPFEDKRESVILQADQSPLCQVYIVEKKLSSGRLSHLKGIAQKKGFPLVDFISDSVTHIVSSLPSYERVQAAVSSPLPDGAEVVSLEWLTTSFMEGKPVQVTDRYRLKKTPASKRPEELAEAKPTLSLLYKDALELLERYYQHLDYKQGDTRALAFRQASCALKAFPKKVTHIDEISNLPRIGRHSGQVIQEILHHGFSTEVEECKSSEWFQCMEYERSWGVEPGNKAARERMIFTSVYGCGPATADRWYQRGLRGIGDVCQCQELELTELQQLGLKYHRHLSLPVSREEAEHIAGYVQSQAKSCFPETSVEAVGGYRRGKPYGHDVDLLLTHPDPDVTDILLETVLDHLHKQGVIIHADVTTGHNTTSHVQHDHINTSRHNFTPDGRQRRVKFDRLDKAFLIMKLEGPSPLPQSPAGGIEREAEGSRGGLEKTGAEEHAPQPSTITRRVDLIVSPPEQYPFALVSWTGSKQFNRSLRRYSVKECNMSVTAHGIYDITQGKFIPAKTEQDVFSILKLKYLEPWERNC